MSDSVERPSVSALVPRQVGGASVGELLYLSQADVRTLLPPLEEGIELVEHTYRAMAAGGVQLPPKTAIHPRPDGFMHAMPAYVQHADAAALKWVAGSRSNKARGLAYITGLIVLNDPETGFTLAVMDAAEITAARTAAASGVCVRRWAPVDWRTAAVIGCGVQAAHHVRVLRLLNPDVVVRGYDPHPERVAALDGVEVATGPREAVRDSDVVITTCPMSQEPAPVLTSDWLAEQYLLLPVDYDASVQASAIAAAELFVVDDIGQFEYNRGHGHFAGWPKPHASVGQALDSPNHPGRVACANLGVGALDAVFAQRVLASAAVAGTGTPLPR